MGAMKELLARTADEMGVPMTDPRAVARAERVMAQFGPLHPEPSAWEFTGTMAEFFEDAARRIEKKEVPA